MKKVLIILGVVILGAGCATTPPLSTAKSVAGTVGSSVAKAASDPTASSYRGLASANELSIAGTWTGKGTVAISGTPAFPLTCRSVVVTASVNGQPCDIYSNSGRLISLNMSCQDDLLSAKGKAVFIQNEQLCQTTEQMKAADGSMIWITNLGLDPRSNPQGGHLTANIGEFDSNRWHGDDVPKTDKLILFSYANRVQFENRSVYMDVSFFKPVSP